MEIVIVEDEKPAARYLARKVEALGYSVKQLLYSVHEAKLWFVQNPNPDLVFMDIQLSDGLSFEIFETIDLKSAIIFTTAYDEYALKAFKLNAVDYLLKPIDPEELEFAINKFKNSAQKNAISLDGLKSLLHLVDVIKNYKERFVIKVGQQMKIIDIKDIKCFYSENKSTYIKTLENRDYLLDCSLESLEQDLNPKDFFKINRKFIIQRHSISEILVFTNSRLKIKLIHYTNDDLIVSREKVSEFKNWIN